MYYIYTYIYIYRERERESPMLAFFLWMSMRIWLCNYSGVTFISSTLVICNLPQKHTPTYAPCD